MGVPSAQQFFVRRDEGSARVGRIRGKTRAAITTQAPLVTAVRADLGSTSGFPHPSNVGHARARLAGSRGTTASIIQ
jgi:hypothetical protein